jgi:hypothetical protein
MAGLRNRDTSDFGGSKMFIPGGFTTLPSKANDMSYDDEDEGFGQSFRPGPPRGEQDDDVPF